MKRRTIDCAKLRREARRNRKFTDSFGSNTSGYVKIITIWMCVLMANHLTGFHFEYLWPVWLMLCSVYDSYKYHGLAFSAFFLGVTITSDALFYLSIPLQWLFCSASTFVWVQYVYQTEKSISTTTVGLWFMFITFEAVLRVQGYKTESPMSIDLCRPLAVHCIGYPVVTLGFGIKSYLSYKFKQRKQREVEKDNLFLTDVIEQALPSEVQQMLKEERERQIQECHDGNNRNGTIGGSTSISANGTGDYADDDNSSTSSLPQDSGPTSFKSNGSSGGISISSSNTSHRKSSHNNSNHSAGSSSGVSSKKVSGSGRVLLNGSCATSTCLISSSTASSCSTTQNGHSTTGSTTPSNAEPPTTLIISKLETDLKKARSEVVNLKNLETDLRSQLFTLSTVEKQSRSDQHQLRTENDSLKQKLNTLTTQRNKETNSLTVLEKKLTEERKAKSNIEQQLASEKKAKKTLEDQLASAQKALQTALAAAANVVLPNNTTPNGRNSSVSNGSGLAGSGASANATSFDKRSQQQAANELVALKVEKRNMMDRMQHLEANDQQLRHHLQMMSEENARFSEALSRTRAKLEEETRLKLDLLGILSENKKTFANQQLMVEKQATRIQSLTSELHCSPVNSVGPFGGLGGPFGGGLMGQNGGPGSHIQRVPVSTASFTVPQSPFSSGLPVATVAGRLHSSSPTNSATGTPSDLIGNNGPFMAAGTPTANQELLM